MNPRAVIDVAVLPKTQHGAPRSAPSLRSPDTARFHVTSYVSPSSLGHCKVNGDDPLVIGPGSVGACFWSFLHIWCRVRLECRPRNTGRAIIPFPAELFLFMADFIIECLYIQSSHITLDNDLAIYFRWSLFVIKLHSLYHHQGRRAHCG